MNTRIDLAEFSKTPFGRYRTDGPNSGERFRDEVLLPTFMETTGPVEVSFDKVSSTPGSSFLEEAFAGLVRKGVPAEEVKERLKISSTKEFYKILIDKLIDMASIQAALQK